MADVRLTATNPEDSSVVPVACNEKGELKLEEIPSFDGNVDGDLTVSGETTIGDASTDNYTKIYNDGGVRVHRAANGSEGIGIYDPSGEVISLLMDGSAKFAGTLHISPDRSINNVSLLSSGKVAARPTTGTSNVWEGLDSSNSVTSEISSNGSALFAGGKAGFTSDGYLWCTTRRGDTVILDATSNGLATWADYTPPTRREQIKESIEGTVQIDPNFGVQPETDTGTP